MGSRLKEIKESDIEDIDKDGKDQNDKRRMLLDRWKERNGCDATYGAMISAMMKEQKRDEAEKVCRLLNASSKLS